MTLQILGLALEALGKRRKAVFGAILVPTLLMVGIAVMGPWAMDSPPGMLFYGGLLLVAHTWLAVSIHRIVILEESFKLRWGWREMRFTGWVILFLAGIAVAIWFIIEAFASIGMPTSGIIGTAFQLLVVVGVLFFTSQYFLIFPAIAVDRKYKLAHSSVDTEENRLATFAVVAVIPVLLWLVNILAAMISAELLQAVVRSLLTVVSITIGVAMLAKLYKELSSGS